MNGEELKTEEEVGGQTVGERNILTGKACSLTRGLFTTEIEGALN